MPLLDIVSIGKACCELQTPVSRITKVAKQLGIEPAARINGVSHYATSDLERMSDEIAKQRDPMNRVQGKGDLNRVQ